MPRPLSLLFDLRKLDRRLQPLPCPVCGASRPLPVLKRDRYFLRVELSICRDCEAVYLARGLKGGDSLAFYGDLYPRLMAMGGRSPVVLGQLRLAAGYRVNAIRAQERKSPKRHASRFKDLSRLSRKTSEK